MSNKLNQFNQDDKVSVMDNQSVMGDLPTTAGLQRVESGPRFMKDNIKV